MTDGGIGLVGNSESVWLTPEIAHRAGDVSFIINRAASSEIKREALKHGLRTLRDDGWTKVLGGITTVEEVLRVSEEDEDDIS